MAKWLDDTDILDPGLTAFTTATELYLTVGQPADRAAAIAATVFPAATPTFSALRDGTSGREVDCQASNGNTANTDATADHVAICTGTKLLAVSTLAAPLAVTNGATVNVSLWTLNFPDPT